MLDDVRDRLVLKSSSSSAHDPFGLFTSAGTSLLLVEHGETLLCGCQREVDAARKVAIEHQKLDDVLRAKCSSVRAEIGFIGRTGSKCRGPVWLTTRIIDLRGQQSSGHVGPLDSSAEQH